MTPTTPTMPPTDDLRRVADAQRRFEDAIAGLDDDAVRRPSLLPGWTVAHLLTHVARNADSHTRRCEGAVRGEVVDQYPGGFEGRAQEIEAGAGRSADELGDDVRGSAQRLDEAWRTLPADGWSFVTRDVGGRARPVHDLPSRRWQELEVHVVDLGVGITRESWSDDFVTEWLPRLRATLPHRLAPGASPPATGTLEPRDELAWLYGRLTLDDLPTLAPWG